MATGESGRRSVKYADGQEVLLGDAVDLGGGSVGRVVAVLDTGR